VPRTREFWRKKQPVWNYRLQSEVIRNRRDEASMIDLPMMAKLLAAIPDGCRLMLVGDSEQLASVDPGRVYADICHAAEPGGKLSGCLTVLTESRRFPADSPVGKIGKAIQEGGDSAWPALNAASGSRVLTHYAAKLALSEDGSFAEWVKRVAAPFRKAKTPKDVLTAAEQFRVLCALRRGPYGVRQMNERIKRILNLPLSSRFYQYQVILIQVNTPALGLYNGDIGVVFKNPDLFEEGKPSGKLFGWFPSDDPEKPRSIPVNLLPEHETAFAMTVHKSQGSEFSALALVLPPDGASPVLTRELIYTGITRVKLNGNSPDEGIRVYCTEDSFKAAVDRKTVRTSGLFETVRRPLGERASLPV